MAPAVQTHRRQDAGCCLAWPPAPVRLCPQSMRWLPPAVSEQEAQGLPLKRLDWAAELAYLLQTQIAVLTLQLPRTWISLAHCLQTLTVAVAVLQRWHPWARQLAAAQLLVNRLQVLTAAVMQRWHPWDCQLAAAQLLACRLQALTLAVLQRLHPWASQPAAAQLLSLCQTPPQQQLWRLELAARHAAAWRLAGQAVQASHGPPVQQAAVPQVQDNRRSPAWTCLTGLARMQGLLCTELRPCVVSACNTSKAQGYLGAFAGCSQQLTQWHHGCSRAHGLQVAAAEAICPAGHMSQVHIVCQLLSGQHHLDEHDQGWHTPCGLVW